MIAEITELLSSILRFFPIILTSGFLFGGAFLGRLPWILAAIGGLVLTLFVSNLQYWLNGIIRDPSWGINIPGQAAVEACSILPYVKGQTVHITTPSLWMALTAYFITYIVINAINIFTQKPSTGASVDIMPVQKRRSKMIISLFTTLLMGFFLIGVRWMNGCERTLGILLGLLLGVLFGGLWWYFIGICSAYQSSDIHGIMSSLTKGWSSNYAMACNKQT